MHYVYVLNSYKDKNHYVGSSDNLKRRFLEHQQGKVKATHNRRPFELIFYETFKHKDDSIRRERYFKTTKGKKSLKQILRSSLE